MQGEGSRGGKIVGHTKSGLPIYQSHHHLNVKALALTTVGIATSLGSGAIGKLAATATRSKKFGTVAKFGSIFVGEAAAAGGSDAVIEDLHMDHEQAAKNVLAGSLGVLGAVSGGFSIRSMKGFFK